MIRNLKTAILALIVAGLIMPWLAIGALAQRGQIAPEAATGFFAKERTVAKEHMVVAANPYAVEAGLTMLRAGGSAVDAAIATQLVLNLVEPQSSGIGGGAFLLHFDSGQKKLRTYDGREVAPAAAKPDRFVDADGRPMPFRTAVHSGLSVGVPGLVRLLEHAHKAHGKLPWGKLFEPAIGLAENGFKVSARLHFLLYWIGSKRFTQPARDYFFTSNGAALPIGHTLRNPEFAQTLRAIAKSGSQAFYRGAVAERIIAAVRNAPNAAGDMTLHDLSDYVVREREPYCVTYRGNNVCGMGPPSSGGTTVAQSLKLLEPFNLGTPMNSSALHLIAEAEKLAYADRNRYLADPDFSPVPSGLLDPAYLARRRELIDDAKAMKRAAPGLPPGVAQQSFGADETIERAGTSHISVIDKNGNAVSMTTTIEGAFGSGLWAAGFLLNNELTDFSFRPVDAKGRPIANRVEGGKRPRSSMAPTIVFDAAGNLRMVTGSPGGSRIILYVIKALLAEIDWGLDAQAGASLMNFGSRGRAFEIELAPSTVWQALKVKAKGHAIAPDLMTSGIHTIVVRDDGTLEGGADPRREGAARGD